MYIYDIMYFAKVIGNAYATYASYVPPLSQLLLTGVRKKSEKSCRKIWRGWGQGRIFALRTSYGISKLWQ